MERTSDSASIKGVTSGWHRRSSVHREATMASAAKPQEGWLWVADVGNGMTETALHRVFAQFAHVERAEVLRKPKPVKAQQSEAEALGPARVLFSSDDDAEAVAREVGCSGLLVLGRAQAPLEVSQDPCELVYAPAEPDWSVEPLCSATAELMQPLDATNPGKHSATEVSHQLRRMQERHLAEMNALKRKHEHERSELAEQQQRRIETLASTRAAVERCLMDSRGLKRKIGSARVSSRQNKGQKQQG